MIKTNALHQRNDPKNPNPKSSKSDKWHLLSPIWYKSKEYQEGVARAYEGKGVVFLSGDPNALLKRLDLLLSSQEAGHTGVRNELVKYMRRIKKTRCFRYESL